MGCITSYVKEDCLGRPFTVRWEIGPMDPMLSIVRKVAQIPPDMFDDPDAIESCKAKTSADIAKNNHESYSFLAEAGVALPPMVPVIAAPSMGSQSSIWQYPLEASSPAVIPTVQLVEPLFPCAMLPLSVDMAACDAEANLDQIATDSQKSFDNDPKDSDESSSTSPVASTPAVQEKDVTDSTARLAEKEMKHKRGECTPCFYFTFRDDGCRRGGDCQFCHLCTKEQCRKREKKLSKLSKRARREDCIDAHGGQPFVSSKTASAQGN